MPSNPNLIPLREGQDMTELFRQEKENVLNPKLQNTGILPICETFDRSVFDMLLANESCVGIRVYSGMDLRLQVKVIVVGVNANNEDIYIEADPAKPGDFSVIENGVRCPDDCPPVSPLNS